MTDRDTGNDDWIAAWIAHQRELLEQRAAQMQTGPSTSSGQGQAEQFASLGAQWAETFQQFLRGLQPAGEGGSSLDPLKIGDAWLDAWTGFGMLHAGLAQQSADIFGRLPPIGLAREHTEAWRELAEAYAHCRQLEQEVRAVLLKVQMDALDLLAARVREKPAEARIDTFRTLHALWVECGEQAYSQVAHSDSYCKLQAELGNATMRLRARMQTVIEHALKRFDLPTRSELNSLHRQVRELRQTVETLETNRRTRRSSSRKSPPRARARARKAKR